MASRRAELRAARYPSPETRLRRRVDFRRCYERGRRRHATLVSAYAVENERENARFGVTITRKVGGAVARNRVRRRLREIYRRWQEAAPPGRFDIVLHVRPSAARASFGDLEREALEVLAAVTSRRPG